MAEIDAKLEEQLKQAEPTAEEAFQKIAEGKKKKKVTYAVLGTATVYNDEQAQVHGFGYLNYKDSDNKPKK